MNDTKEYEAVSMTGFGSQEGTYKGITLAVRLRSVNQRFLEISLRTPSSWAGMDAELRKRIQARASRGKIDVYVQRKETAEDAPAELPALNRELLSAYKEVYLAGIKEALGIAADLTVDECRDILRKDGVITLKRTEEEDSAGEIEVFWKLFDEALDSFIESRRVEGRTIAEQLAGYFDDLDGLIQRFEELSVGLVSEHVEKMKARVGELLGSHPVDEARMAQEVAYLADRFDLSEELQRLKAHSEACRSLLVEGMQGKKLDFLCQEIFREVNTAGSKCQNSELQHLMVEAKSLIEKVREQAQNIE